VSPLPQGQRGADAEFAVPRATILKRAATVLETSLYAHNCDVIQSTFTSTFHRFSGGVDMSGQIIQMRSIALAVPLLVWGVGIGVPTSSALADDCAPAPRSVAPAGSHWYYHLDRKTRRKCWFVAPLGQPGQHRAAKGSSPAARSTRTSAAEKSATASAGALKPVSADANAAQAMTVDSAATPDSARQRAQDTSAAQSNPWASAPLASASPQISAPAVAPATTIVWPDPAPIKAQEPKLLLTDARSDAALPPVRSPDPSQGAVQAAAPAPRPPSVESSPAARLVEILLVGALGLAMAGVMYHAVMKIGARRAADQRRSLLAGLDRRAMPTRMPPRPPTAWIPHDRERVLDNLPPSLVPAAGEYRVRRPLRADDARPNKARGRDSTSRVADTISGRENTLAQLIVDLEQLLKSRKEA
jgi:hypothetical protein